MEQTNKNLQSLYRLSPSDSYLDEPNGRTLGAQVSAQAAAQLGRLALNSARADKFSSLNFTQNWNIPGFEQRQSAASDELATLSAAALEAYAYQEDYDLSPEDYASLMRVRHYVKNQDEARAQALGTPANEPAPDNKPRYAIYRSGAVMPLRPTTKDKEQPSGYSKPMSYGMSKGIAQSVGLERNLGTERYAQYVNLQPSNNATTRITMSTSSARAHAMAAAHPEGLLVDVETGLVINDTSQAQLSYEATPEVMERMAPEQEIIATVVDDDTTAVDDEATVKTEAEVTTMTTDAKDEAAPRAVPAPQTVPAPQAVPAPKSEPVRQDEVIASSEGVRIVRTIKQTFVPSPDTIVARHSMTRERWGEYGLKGVGGRPLTNDYPRPEDDYYVPTPSTMRPLTVAEAQAALDAARRRQAYGVENAEENGDHIANAVLVRNSTTRIVTNSRKAAADYEKSAALDAELERLKQAQAPESGDEGPATVISRHAVMQRPVKSAAELLAEAQAQIIAPIAASPDAGWENALGREYTPTLAPSSLEPSAKVEPSAEVLAAEEVAPEVPAFLNEEVIEPEVREPEVQDVPEVSAEHEQVTAEPEQVAVPEVAASAVEPVLEPERVVAPEVVAAPEFVAAPEVVAETVAATPVEAAAPVAEVAVSPAEEEAPLVAPSELEAIKGRRSRRNKTRARAKAAAAAALAEVNGAEPQAVAAQSEPKVEVKVEPKSEPKVEVKPEPQVKAEPEVKAEPQVKAEPEVKAEPQVKAEPAVSPDASSGDGSAHRRKRRRR